MYNSFVRIRGDRNERKEWAGKVLLLARCSVNGESDGDELATVRYLVCVSVLDKAGEAVKSVRLNRAALGSSEGGKNVERSGC